jgi:addiction module toxin, relE/stbE family|nr:MAG TPA: Plasmid stabilization system protein [Caudoviricetes sp.]
MYALKFYPKAKQDLVDIYDYISRELGNPDAAQKLLDAFEKGLVQAREIPFSCPKIVNVPVKNKEIRKLIVENYIIFYLANEQEKQIEVVRILYGMMDYHKIL